MRGAQGDAVRRGRAQVHLTGIHGNGAPRTKASLVIGSVQRVATARTAAGEQRVRYAQQLHAAHVHVGASAVHVQLALQVVRPEAPIDQAEGAHQDVAQPHLQVGQAVRVGGRVVRLLVHHRPRRNALPDAHAEGHVLPGQGFTQRIAHHALVVEGLGRLAHGHGRYEQEGEEELLHGVDVRKEVPGPAHAGQVVQTKPARHVVQGTPLSA